MGQQLASNTNQLNNQVANLQAQANNVQAGIRSLQRSTNVNQARANEVGAVADYVLSSRTKQFIAGTGIFTPQHVGYYQICSYSRFQLGGNAVEMCIRKGSTRVACYGNAVQYDWRSTGVCTIQNMALTDTI